MANIGLNASAGIPNWATWGMAAWIGGAGLALACTERSTPGTGAETDEAGSGSADEDDSSTEGSDTDVPLDDGAGGETPGELRYRVDGAFATYGWTPSDDLVAFTFPSTLRRFDAETGAMLEERSVTRPDDLAPLHRRSDVSDTETSVGAFLQSNQVHLGETRITASTAEVVWTHRPSELSGVPVRRALVPHPDGGGAFVYEDAQGRSRVIDLSGTGDARWELIFGDGVGAEPAVRSISRHGSWVGLVGERTNGGQAALWAARYEADDGAALGEVAVSNDFDLDPLDAAWRPDGGLCVAGLAGFDGSSARPVELAWVRASGDVSWRVEAGPPVPPSADPDSGPIVVAVDAAPDGSGCCLVSGVFDGAWTRTALACIDAGGNLTLGRATDIDDPEFYADFNFTEDGDLLVILGATDDPTGPLRAMERLAAPF